MSKIAILLSTYNGEKYLKQQLDSLQNQTYREFNIIARDDGSSDNTFEKYILQGKAFLELYGKDMNEFDRKMLEEFSRFSELTKWQKLKVLYTYKIWKNGLMRNLGLVLFA